MFYYLASPYSKKHPNGEWDHATMQERFESVVHAAGWLLSRECFVFSPIVYTHEIAKRYKLPVTHDFWTKLNHEFIRSSRGIIILAIDGWRESRGIADEVEQAGLMHKSVSLMYRNFNEYVIRPQGFEMAGERCGVVSG